MTANCFMQRTNDVRLEENKYNYTCYIKFTMGVFPVGHTAHTDDVKDFALLTPESSVSGLCTWTEPPTCVATPVDDLQWHLHGHHAYYITLKLEGVNGLERVASSKEYEHDMGPPSAGIVAEIPVDTTKLVSKSSRNTSLLTILRAWYITTFPLLNVIIMIEYFVSISSFNSCINISYTNYFPNCCCSQNLS